MTAYDTDMFHFKSIFDISIQSKGIYNFSAAGNTMRVRKISKERVIHFENWKVHRPTSHFSFLFVFHLTANSTFAVIPEV